MSAEAPIEPVVVSDQATKAATIEPVEPPATTTTTAMAVNIFGRENLDRVTRRQVFSILRGLGKVDPDEKNLRAMAEKAIIQTATLIFSDALNPEDITCYLPTKDSKNALVHGEAGWEVRPVDQVTSQMASQAVEVLFRCQPLPLPETSIADYDWMVDECPRIMSYLANNERNICREAPQGEASNILVRNKPSAPAP